MKLFLIGGFLGSGKTTGISQACSLYIAIGQKVAVITNDQGEQLVDTAFIKSEGIITEQVANGCFCCNYGQLSEKISSLQEEHMPEIIFAESVGSCTDLIATITKPLAKTHPHIEVIISVFADVQLLLTLIRGTSCFLDETVQYIYKKQIEEADILIINKIDLLNKGDLKEVKKIVKSDYPKKKILFQNSFDRTSVGKWMKELDNFNVPQYRKSLSLDYDIYAAGEAKLAWLDQDLSIFTIDNTAYNVALDLLNKIYTAINEREFPIGHLKFLIDDGKEKIKISFTTAGQDKPDPLIGSVRTNNISLLINARVQTEPDFLRAIVDAAIAQATSYTGARIMINNLSSFKPAYPRPTHRILV